MGLREQQARMTALEALEQAQRTSSPVGTIVENMQQSTIDIALSQDVEKIRKLDAFTDRNGYKKNYFLPKWLPVAEQHFLDGRTDQNDVIGYCLIYLLDVEDFNNAFLMANKAIENGQKLPSRFASSIPLFVVNSVLDWTKKTTAKGESVEPYFSQILKKILTEWKINEIPESLFMKQAAIQLLVNRQGKAHTASVDDPMRLIFALQLLNKAFSLNQKVGVKSLIDRIYMRLNALKEQYEESKAEIAILTNPNQMEDYLKGRTIDIDGIVNLLNTPPLSFQQVIDTQGIKC